MLAALLTVLLLTQTLCITAFAENPVEVLIPQGSETNAILTAALIPDATETQSWEYKCEGTSKIFTKNTAWGSVNGFESSTKKLGITTTYTHAALAANTDGQYQVRVAGTTKEYTIEKKAKLTSGIELNTGVSVALVYGEDGTLDAAATEDAIVRAVVKSVKPADAALTVEYYATATSGSLGSAGKDWAPIAGGKSGLLTYPAGGFCFVPDELLAEKSLRGGLSAFVGTELSFVGISEPFTVAAGDEAPHDLTVLIPKSDYDRALLKSRLEAAGVLMLLLFFAVSCCLFYTRRYLRPILRDIERLKDESGGTQMTFDELQPVSARLRSHEQTITVLETEKLDLQGQVEHMQSQVVDTQEQLDDSLAEIRRLAYLGKKELDPADYQKFLEGYAKLSSKELEICAALAKGLSARQCAEQTGNALSTIDTYRKRVYEKTNIHRVRQLRLCYALMQLEQAEQDK